MTAAAVQPAVVAATGPTTSRGMLGRLWRRAATALPLAFLAGLVLLAVLAPLIAPFDPIKNNLSNVLASPGADHWLGTDELGRDVLSRLLHGARVSLLASSIAVGVAVVLGFPIGLLAGLRGGRLERWTMSITDGLMAMPGLIVIIAVVAVFGSSMLAAMVTLGVILSPSILRIVRAVSVDVRNELYVDAARTLGLSTTTIARRHVLPHVVPALIVQVSLTMGIALLSEAGLSYLGVGIQPPRPSWGGMLAKAGTYVYQQPFLVLPPGLAITAVVLALNLLGDGIRDQLGAGIRRQTRARSSQPADPPAPVPMAAGADAAPVADVSRLSVAFPDAAMERADRAACQGAVDVVSDVSFRIGRGEIVGLVGESGCGKSITALSLLGLVPPPGTARGSIVIDGQQVVGTRDRTLGRLRGNTVGLVFQDPMSSLDPAFTIGAQIAEAIQLHRRVSRGEARRRAIGLLDQVGITDPHRRIDAYPHQFSGGMAQRVMIAAALAADPQLLIADEPTTALDVTVQAEILELLRTLQRERQLAVLLVTHDLGVVADLCQRAIVMYAGEVVEEGPVEALFAAPQHPYTRALLGSLPDPEAGHRRLGTIAGAVPQPGAHPPGCRFAPRCDVATAECSVRPIDLRCTDAGAARCILVPRRAVGGDTMDGDGGGTP